MGVAYRRGITVSGGIGPDRFSIASGSLPPGVTLSASTGLLSGTPTRPGAYDFTVRVADSGPHPDGVARNGAAAKLGSPLAGSGLGLAGIAERVASCGGNLTVGPTPAGGFAVTARLPAL